MLRSSGGAAFQAVRLIRGAVEEALGERIISILTDAAGALKGLFEAQKRLAGNRPSFANSFELEL